MLSRERRSSHFSVLGASHEAPAPEPGLHIVATPIGNLLDMTLRGLTLLAGVDAILAEDTRMTRRLLDRYEIATPLVAYHEHNAAEARPAILARLAEGQALALVSDAGTPLISDPGYRLVLAAVEAGAAVHTAPGASALLAALTLAGLPTDSFFFDGFLPPKSAARRERLNALAQVPATLVFYELPRRVAETLADLALELGDRPAAAARELTKLHEEVVRGTLSELAARFAAGEEPRGEFVLLVGPPAPVPPPDAADLDSAIVEALGSLSVKDAAAAVAAKLNLPRREVYARALVLAGQRR